MIKLKDLLTEFAMMLPFRDHTVVMPTEMQSSVDSLFGPNATHMAPPQLTLDELLDDELYEAKDETNVHKNKPMPRHSRYNKTSWEWRIHSKGSYWQSGKDWGARAQSGEVDHFPDKSQAVKFANWMHPGQSGTYVQGQFAKGKFAKD